MKIFKENFIQLFSFIMVSALIFCIAIFVDQFSHKNVMARNADKIINLCKDEKHRPTCYDLEIPKLMKNMSLEETFIVTRMIQDKDIDYPYCHVLGHLIGSIETAKDPEKWKDVAGRCPTDMCSNGCMHGVFQERFRSESIPDTSVSDISSLFSGVCEERKDWNKTKLEQTSCTHALGHLTMYITEANTVKSLLICDRVSLNKEPYDFRPFCYDGVFMQLFQPLDPDDFALIEGKVPSKNQIEKFCSNFSGEAHNSCWSESWPLKVGILKENPSNVVNFCNKLSDDKSIKQCIQDIFYIIAVQFNLDDKKNVDYCKKASGKIKDQCFTSVAMRILDVDSRNIERAVNFCNIAQSFGSGNDCYKMLSSHAPHNFNQGSREFNLLCKSLPSGWKEKCFSGTL